MRYNLSIVYVIAYLPAYAAVVMQHPDALFNNPVLLGKVLVQFQASLIRFAEIVGW